MKNRIIHIDMMKTIYYISLLSLLYSCTDGSKTQLRVDNQIDINNAITSNIKEYIYDNVDTIIIIPLETSDESLLGNVYNYEIGSNYVYIINDNSSGKGISIFKRDGKFISKIPNGQGPNEVNTPTDITFNTEKKCLLVKSVDNTIKVFSETGKYITTYNNDYDFDDFIAKKNGNGYVVFQGPRCTHNLEPALLEVDSCFNIKKIYDGILRTIPSSTAHALSYDKDGNILLSRMFDNNIYVLKDDTIEIKYNINFKEHELLLPEDIDIFKYDEYDSRRKDGYATPYFSTMLNNYFLIITTNLVLKL